MAKPLNFRPVGVRPKKSSLLRNLRKTILDSVVTFFSIKVPLAPGNFVLVFFRPGPNFLQVPKGQNGPNPTTSLFPAGGGPTKKKYFPRKVQKTFLNSVVTFFSIKVPLAPYCVFVFSGWARNFSKCQRPKMDQTPAKLLFPAGGFEPKQHSQPRKLRETTRATVAPPPPPPTKKNT